MKDEGRCRNCNEKIDMVNNRIGSFRCRKCYGVECKMAVEEVIERVARAIEFRKGV